MDRESISLAEAIEVIQRNAVQSSIKIRRLTERYNTLLKALKDIRAIPGKTRRITPYVKDEIIAEMDSAAYLALAEIKEV